MLIAYFDESGHSRQTDFVSMAACVGRYDQWKMLDQQWNAALAKHRAPYLHMREFAHSIGPFKEWTEPQRRGLMADCLAAVTASRLVLATACVRVADFIGFQTLQHRERRAAIGHFMSRIRGHNRRHTSVS
jgi:hypothetical protein